MSVLCGKYNVVKQRGVICEEKCGVGSWLCLKLRRETMGQYRAMLHFVAHILGFLNLLPSPYWSYHGL